ncbi:MAG: T9SS type A sorting domain-containing protein [Bacteroidota bacterium]
MILTGQSNLSTYNWSNGDTTASILVDQNGSFWLNVTDPNGCSSENSDTVNVIVNPLPPIPSISANGPLAFCQGEQVILSGPVGYTYLWSTGDTTELITISDSVQISLIVTDANGCSRPSTDTLQTQVLTQPNVPTISLGGASEFCEGDSVDLSSTPASAYNWSTGDTTQQITVSLSGIYALVIENADGCQSDSAFSPQIVVNPLPAQPTIQANGPLEFCEGDSVILSSPQGFISYVWSTGDSTDQLIIKESGAFTLEVTDANGCKSPISDTTFVNVSPQPDNPSISVLGSTLFCEGGSVILEATPGGAGSYQWTNGDTTDVITVGASGSYSVWVESNEGCISFSPDTIKVSVIARPDTPLIQPLGTDSLISSVSGDRYEWYQDGILLIDSTQAIQASATGEYVVIVFNDSCGSAPSDTFSFVVSSLVSQYESDIQLYPNPSEKTLFIQGNGLPEGELELRIYDARGREVLRRYVRTKDGGLSTRVEVSSWARSVYQVSLTSAEREILYLGKFMKE